MPNLRELLADLTGGEPERAEQAALALPQFGKQALKAISELTQQKNADTHWWATRALAGFSQSAAGELLTTALSDTDVSVRHCAAVALAKRPHAGAIPELIQALQSDDLLFARLAADALVALGGLAVDPLITGLEAEPLNARVEAARALALIGDTRAVSALFKLLESDSIVLQHWANEGLEKMGVGMSFFAPT